MILADAILYGATCALDWVCRRIGRGPAWLLPALMLLLFTIVGGME